MENDEATPPVIQRPVLNPANRSLVMILHNLILELEAFPRQLAELARMIQMSSDPVGAAARAGISQVIHGAGEALARGADAMAASK